MNQLSVETISSPRPFRLHSFIVLGIAIFLTASWYSLLIYSWIVKIDCHLHPNMAIFYLLSAVYYFWFLIIIPSHLLFLIAYFLTRNYPVQLPLKISRWGLLATILSPAIGFGSVYLLEQLLNFLL